MATTHCQTLAHHIYSIYHHHPPPAVVAIPAIPLVSAQMGQARAFSLTPTATSCPPPTPYATSPPLPPAVSNRVHHITAADEHHHQLTTTTDPQTPPNATNNPQTPHHHRRRPLHTTSLPLTTTGCHVTADDSRRQVTPAASPLEGCRHWKPMGGSEEERGGQDMEWGGRGMGNEEAGETGNGEGRGRPFMPPPSLFFFLHFERGQHLLPLCLFFSIRGSTCCPPFLSFLNGGSTCCPCFFSFRFEWGAAHAAPIFFHFELGRRETYTLPPFLSFTPPITGGVSLPCSVDKWGGVKPTRRCRSFRLPPPNHWGFVFFATNILY